jgi:hypothetical protein
MSEKKKLVGAIVEVQEALKRGGAWQALLRVWVGVYKCPRS